MQVYVITTHTACKGYRMNKNYPKVVVFIFMICAATNVHPAFMTNYFYPGSYLWFNVSHYLNAHGAFAWAVKDWVQYRNSVPSLPDAPPAVTAFCRQKCAGNDISETVHVKIKQGAFLEAFGTTSIVMSKEVAHELDAALADMANEQSKRIVDIYGFLIDHEISHLRGNDSVNRLGILALGNIAAHIIFSQLMNSSHLFEKPNSFKGFAKSYFAFGITSNIKGLFAGAAMVYYALHQERKADAYAVQRAQDPRALRGVAKFFEDCENQFFEFMEGNVNAPASFSFMQRIILDKVRAYLIGKYAQQKPREDFKSWLKKQTLTLACVRFYYDPVHPDGYMRASLACKKAEELETHPRMEPAVVA